LNYICINIPFIYVFEDIVQTWLLLGKRSHEISPNDNFTNSKFITMKRFVNAFLISAVLMALSISVQAQVSATATASATIVTPIAIANATDMDFGNVAVSATPGTVVLDPAGARTVTGGVTLPAAAGTVTAASFDVTGQASFTYSITLPAAATTITSGGNTMTVDTWISTPTPTGTLDGAGTQTLAVGATLNVAAGQASGTYISGTPFTVTVNYN